MEKWKKDKEADDKTKLEELGKERQANTDKWKQAEEEKNKLLNEINNWKKKAEDYASILMICGSFFYLETISTHEKTIGQNSSEMQKMKVDNEGLRKEIEKYSTNLTAVSKVKRYKNHSN